MNFPYFWVEAVRFGKFFSIRKLYFLQVKNLTLVGTLEKTKYLNIMNQNPLDRKF
ncbi:hypothetical protein G436_1567 [Leptospira interrogans serovar Hardjo str. Norma]|uniref:Uncharacterized protein n=1 Tax=Leptospira interrogans serovar Hardjo str. Norma TaxID=1279460 RepID=A0A0M4NV13_LEPIR|nr:hypothetical protein G436_1567 [Leptospira interrogans serovar Hardjo str. Norma]